MTSKAIAVAAFALPLIAAGSACGPRQQISPPSWQQPEPARGAPYGLTGSESPRAPAGSCWRREVERLGNKVEVDTFRRCRAGEEGETR